MKRILFTFLIMFIGIGMAYSQILVTTPNGGENWQKTATESVTWNTGGVAGNVIIQLFQGGTSQGAIYNGANTGSFGWEIDNYLNSTPIALGSYRLQVKSLSDTSIKDQSDADFNITAPAGSITVTDPNGGECWETGSTTHNVTWTSSGVTGNVIIQLMQGGTSQGSIYNGANSGSFVDWEIDNYLNGTPIAVGSYRLQVKSLNDTSVLDQSNAFEISNDCGGGIIVPDNYVWKRLKEILSGLKELVWWKEKIKFPKPWPDPDPDPWDPCFSLKKLRDIFFKAKFKEQVKIELFKDSLKVGALGTFGPKISGGENLSRLTIIPESVVMKRISRRGSEMLKSGDGRGFKMVFKNMAGKIMITLNVKLKIIDIPSVR